MKIFITILITILVVIQTVFIFIFSGIYNVAADHPHSAATIWLLDVAMHRSVDARAYSIKVPPDFRNLDISKGKSAYNSTCANCHGGSAKKAEVFVRGFNPSPPDLQESAEEMRTSSIYWIANHGIKMTGMPAFNQVLTEDELWAVTAYIISSVDEALFRTRNY